jgi:predicted transglutaminase-like cysteine proteinase
LKPPFLAPLLLLAATVLLAGPFAAKDAGWSRGWGLASGMGSAPERTAEQNTTPRMESGSGKAPAADPLSGSIQAGNSTQETTRESKQVGTESLASQAAPEPMPARDKDPQNGTAPERETPPLPDHEKEPGLQSTAQKPARPEPARVPPAQNDDKPWRTSSTSPKKEPARGQGSEKNAEPMRLFQSAAFRGTFEAVPKWKRVLSKARDQVRVLGSCTGAGCPPGATSWQRIMQQARGQDPMEQLKLVTAFFNKWPYRLDMDAYGASDWWATPQEFLKLSGDCEDYAITKYFALRELGFSQDDLRIVIVRDRIRGIGHAVLAVFLQGEAYVLDNLTNSVFAHGKYKHYTPQYSLNEEFRWSHIPLAKQP